MGFITLKGVVAKALFLAFLLVVVFGTMPYVQADIRVLHFILGVLGTIGLCLMIEFMYGKGPQWFSLAGATLVAVSTYGFAYTMKNQRVVEIVIGVFMIHAAIAAVTGFVIILNRMRKERNAHA